jgi:hypothetical protein
MDRMPASPVWESHQSASRLLPFLFVVGGCLLVGLFMGALAGGKYAPSKPAGRPAVNFILLGYDNLKVTRRLTAVWVVTFDGAGYADYLGYSPSTILTLDNNQPAVLRDYLADPLGAPVHLFRISKIPQPATTIEFDNLSLLSIINRSGGVNLDGKILHGQDILSMFESMEDSLEALRLQARIVQILFRSTGPCMSESTLAGLGGEHVISSVPLDQIIQDCVDHGPYMDDAIRVKVFDQVLPMILPDGSTGLFATH